jgi:hypothetical protein
MRCRAITAAMMFAASTLASQTIPNTSAAFFAPRLDTVRHGDGLRSIPFRALSAQKYAPIASAIIPGSGQYMLGNDRFIGYLAIEVIGWWQYGKSVRERAAQETEYKSLARRVARASFTLGSPDQLPDGDWAYYEQLLDYDESGSFSLTVGGPIAPETNPATYNGSRWLLAQATFSTRDGAIAEYMRTAVRPEYEWSWKNAQLEKDVYSRTIFKRNDANRAVFSNLMVIGANHALSMIDAFTTFRLRASNDPGRGTSVGMSIAW